jgi:hypothetical protein
MIVNEKAPTFIKDWGFTLIKEDVREPPSLEGS